MTATQFNPGSGDVVSAIIKTHDGSRTEEISGLVVGFGITQSMNTMSYVGYIHVLDAAGFMENLPLRSSEKLDLKIRVHDLNEEIQLKTHVYKIDDIAPGEAAGSVMYKIHFVSNVSYQAGKRKIISAFSSKSMDMVARSVFDTYFSKLKEKNYFDDENNILEFASYRMPLIDEPEREFIAQPSVNVTDLVIPDYVPVQAMGLAASLAYNPDSPSCSYKFFETLSNFYFVTDEYLIKTNGKRPKKLFYAPAASIRPDNPLDQINRVEGITIENKGLSSGEDIYSGAYRSQVTEIDFLRRHIEVHEYNYDDETTRYIDMSGTIRDINDDPYTPEFRAETFTSENAKNFLVFKDYQRNGDLSSQLNVERYLPQIIGNKLSYQHHLRQTAINISMKGRMDIEPGMIIDLDIQELHASDTLAKNKTLSGKYLVDTINHTQETTTTVINTGARLLKFGWNKGDTNV